MTHRDIYTKFLIAYDKANITSSYPSLTDYEIATLLDRAYLALISLKLTGNNVRGASFEADLKAIEDLLPLVTTTDMLTTTSETSILGLSNTASCKLPEDLLYFILAKSRVSKEEGLTSKNVIIKLVTHLIAQNFMTSANNIPWMKNFVGYIEGNYLTYMFDNFKYSNRSILNITNTPWNIDGTIITYIRSPKKFAAKILEENDIPNYKINVYKNYYNNPNKILIIGGVYKNGIIVAPMTFSVSSENKTYIQIVNHNSSEGSAEITILPACLEEKIIPIQYLTTVTSSSGTYQLQGQYDIVVIYDLQQGSNNARVVLNDTANPNVKVLEIVGSDLNEDSSRISISVPSEYNKYVSIVGNYLIINSNAISNISIPIEYHTNVYDIANGSIEANIIYSEKNYILDAEKITTSSDHLNRVGYFRLNTDRLA